MAASNPHSYQLVLLLVQVAATWSLVGLIWTIQVLHYPLFAKVGAGFRAYEQAHTVRITPLVATLMGAELVSAAFLLFEPPAGIPFQHQVWGAILLAIIWLSTATLQGPLHGRLLAGFDERVLRRLVNTNWIRTLAWTARGVLCLWGLWCLLGQGSDLLGVPN